MTDLRGEGTPPTNVGGLFVFEGQVREAVALGGLHLGRAPTGDEIDERRHGEGDDGEDELPVFVDDAAEHGSGG